MQSDVSYVKLWNYMLLTYDRNSNALVCYFQLWVISQMPSRLSFRAILLSRQYLRIKCHGEMEMAPLSSHWILKSSNISLDHPSQGCRWLYIWPNIYLGDKLKLTFNKERVYFSTRRGKTSAMVSTCLTTFVSCLSKAKTRHWVIALTSGSLVDLRPWGLV